MTNLRKLLVVAGVVAAALPLASQADEHGHPGHEGPGRGVWHGDIGRFHEHDWNVWRGGHWIHDRHDGRWGWWWVAGGLWYFYPSPVYPYPNPYEPPPVELVTPSDAAPPPPPPRYWYYCDASRGYYPYVPTCPGGWRQVPATPAATPGAPPP
ncbi:MAG TPA: hypothetical protein VMU33_15285, partial [Burkholderiaceae bacterium]|nr:hypothetical protein [Burkholderiaceae bacterium]